jgi:Ca-activated chloride channel family protein
MNLAGTGRRAAARQILLIATTLGFAAWAANAALLSAQERPSGPGFSFKTGVDLINITATVTDGNGRFVPGLRRDDFIVYEDGKPQVVSQFDAERVPVSLGIALDTSGSMYGEKIAAAQAALNRFLFDLLGQQDEVFLYRFAFSPVLVQPWTLDRQAVARALGAVRPSGGTAIYDTLAEAVPLAQTGSRRKKALVLISDGQDTTSTTGLPDVRQLIRQTEVLIYAVGIDASEVSDYSPQPPVTPGAAAPRTPSPFPGKKPVAAPAPPPPARPPATQPKNTSLDRVNVDALRAITDESGGRTEVISSSRDLDPATAGIADELSRQYFLGYVSSLSKDGRWHTIEVQVRRGNYTVRARKGFVAN